MFLSGDFAYRLIYDNKQSGRKKEREREKEKEKGK